MVQALGADRWHRQFHGLDGVANGTRMHEGSGTHQEVVQPGTGGGLVDSGGCKPSKSEPSNTTAAAGAGSSASSSSGSAATASPQGRRAPFMAVGTKWEACMCERGRRVA